MKLFFSIARKHILVLFSLLLCLCMCACTSGTHIGVSETTSDASTVTIPENSETTQKLTYYYCDIINDDTVIIPVTAPDNSLFYYDKLAALGDKYITLYNSIVYAATHLSNPDEEYHNVSRVYLAEDTTSDDLIEAYEAVYFDHPELWYLRQSDKKGCVLSSTTNKMFYLTYSDNIEDIPHINADIEEKADEIIFKGSRIASDLDKLAFLSGYLYDNCIVSWNIYNESQHSTIKEMLLEDYGVCIGYASSLAYMLHRMGVSAIIGHGWVPTGMDHCWTITEYNGTYAYTDVYFMHDKGSSTEHSTLYFFNFNTDEVYDVMSVNIAPGVLLPGSKVGERVVKQANPESNATSSALENASNETESEVLSA